MELFAADGHDAGGCERVTGKSGMRPYPGTVHGTFFWDTNIASNELYQSFWADARSFNIRGKPASEVVQRQYACYER